MKACFRCPVTATIILLTIAVYMINGPVTDPNGVVSVQDHIFGVIRHGSWGHLGLNCGVLALGGWMGEPRIGPVATAFLAMVCAGIGVGAELLLAGPGFIGLSGAAYGMAAFGMIVTAPPGQRGINAAIIAGVIGAEIALLRQGIAVYTHLAAALTGGGIAMFASLFGAKGPTLRPMEWGHVARVVEIIAQTDEDDAAEAESTLLDQGYDNMFVLVEKGHVLGVTGFGLDEQVPDVAWLSWTYLDTGAAGQGLGSQMLNDLLGSLSKKGVRKIFIETSDYQEDGEFLYAAAHRLYEDFGAEIELTLPDYHTVGEAKIIYGLDNPEAPATPAPDQDAASGLKISGLQKAAETKDVAGLMWDEAANGLTGLDRHLSEARKHGFRLAVLPIPSDMSSANQAALETGGMQHQGTLKDYYCTGLHQEWWTRVL